MDENLLDELQQPEVAAALAEEGIHLPSGGDAVEQLAREYFDAFLGPGGTPLVQSLWDQGSYEGPSVTQIREIARSAALEYERSAVRNAPVDHLGSILLLWAELAETAPTKATLLARHHLGFAARALQPVIRRGGFYGAVADACRVLAIRIAAPSPDET